MHLVPCVPTAVLSAYYKICQQARIANVLRTKHHRALLQLRRMHGGDRDSAPFIWAHFWRRWMLSVSSLSRKGWMHDQQSSHSLPSPCRAGLSARHALMRQASNHELPHYPMLPTLPPLHSSQTACPRVLLCCLSPTVPPPMPASVNPQRQRWCRHSGPGESIFSANVSATV